MKNGDLERLLRSAAEAGQPEPVEMPFGFDTRVIALWRANGNAAAGRLSAFVRQIAFIATAVIVITGAGVYYQLSESRDLSEPAANEFAIADSVIQDEFAP
jgi:hypothetical protein